LTISSQSSFAIDGGNKGIVYLSSIDELYDDDVSDIDEEKAGDPLDCPDDNIIHFGTVVHLFGTYLAVSALDYRGTGVVYIADIMDFESVSFMKLFASDGHSGNEFGMR
jgi:hypothetical protein